MAVINRKINFNTKARTKMAINDNNRKRNHFSNRCHEKPIF